MFNRSGPRLASTSLSRLAKLLPQDKRADGFRNTAYNLNVDLGHVEAYAKLAEAIVAKMDVEAFAKRFSKSRRLTDDNMRPLIAEMGKWVLRGPLDEDEVVVYRGISTTVASAGGDFREAVSLVFEAMLQSPRFLYRIENQVGDGSPWAVDAYELASRMSYILWGSPPDEALLRAAESGELSDPQQVRRQIARMLEDPRAIEQSKQFVTQWLNLDRLDNMQPQCEEVSRLASVNLPTTCETKRSRSFSTSFGNNVARWLICSTPNSPMLTPRLAKHYGLRATGQRTRSLRPRQYLVAGRSADARQRVDDRR